MPNVPRSSLVVRLSWFLSALLFVSGCLGTETGNPPVIDGSLLMVIERGEELEISGGAGAVWPGGSTLFIVDLNTEEIVRTLTTAKDGSFSVLVGKHVRPALQAENKNGKSGEEVAPMPQSAGAPPADAAGGSAVASATDASLPVTTGAPIVADSGVASPRAADASVSTGGATIASITANGTGCPAGVWSVERVPDGTALNVLFVGYEARVEPNASFAIKDCILALKVNSRQRETFALTSAVYDGTASVSADATAELTISYALQGEPSTSTPSVKSFVPQAAAAFTFQDDIAESRLVWSPCGVTRDINITTRVSVRGGAGAVGIGRVSGIKLSTRACTP